MAIALRGTPTTGSAINGADITLSMPAGLAQGDVVVVGYFMNGAASNTTSSSGWTRIDGGAGTSRLKVFRKVIGASPDANIVLTGSAAGSDSSTACAIAFSGVDNGAPEGGVAVVLATATSTNPDPAAITPNRTGSVSVIYAGTSLVDVTGTGAPAGYSNFSQNSSSDTLSTSSYLAWKSGLVGGTSENPGTFTGVSSALWDAATIVLAPPPSSPDISVGPNVPPALLKKGLAAALALGSIVGPLSPPVAPAAPPPLFDLSIGPNLPPAYFVRTLTTAARDTSSGYEWVPQVPTAAAPTQYNYGFHNERHVYRPVKPVVARLGTINQAPAEPPPVAFTTTEWIFAPFSQPVRVYELRRGDVASPPGGFSFQQPSAETPTDLWWPKWQEPPHRLKARPRLEGFVAWPGIGYTTTIPVPTPTEWWRTQWTDPAQFLRPRRSVGLLGQVAWDPPQQAAPTQYNFEVHNERHLYSPAKRSPLLLGQVAWPGVGYAAVVVVTPTEGWRSAFAQPFKLFQPPRQQGFTSFAGTQGLPVTFSPGPWAVQPAAYWAQQRNRRLAASWPWQAYSFTVPAATPSALWYPVWQERPKERLRSIYLRQGSWAAWDPQFVIQITPPTPLEGVTFTFGLKRGASATPGTKEGATMTGQRKVGGATLITRVKPRNS